MLNKKCSEEKTEGKTNEKHNFSIIVVLVFSICATVIASVAIPAYNSYIRTSKEKIALNFAAMVAQSASAYYAQNDIIPWVITDLHVWTPSGYSACLLAGDVVAGGDGSPGYVPHVDFCSQTVTWR